MERRSNEKRPDYFNLEISVICTVPLEEPFPRAPPPPLPWQEAGFVKMFPRREILRLVENRRICRRRTSVASGK